MHILFLWSFYRNIGPCELICFLQLPQIRWKYWHSLNSPFPFWLDTLGGAKALYLAAICLTGHCLFQAIHGPLSLMSCLEPHAPLLMDVFLPFSVNSQQYYTRKVHNVGNVWNTVPGLFSTLDLILSCSDHSVFQFYCVFTLKLLHRKCAHLISCGTRGSDVQFP